MAELVDAYASGAYGSNPLEVRVLFWAQIRKIDIIHKFEWNFDSLFHEGRSLGRNCQVSSQRLVGPNYKAGVVKLVDTQS